VDYASLYDRFNVPIADFDCGQYCAPFNTGGRNGPSRGPFCCDTYHAVPTVYLEEWEYLQVNTDLWHPWQGRTPAETRRVQEETPDNMLLVECLGYQHCQRNFRSITCRAFPFFPYITRDDWFIGMTYYWQFEYACWVISNLQVVTPQYRGQFFAAYDELFERYPQEREGYRLLSSSMRRVFSRWGRSVPILHRDGNAYQVTPKNGKLSRVDTESFPKHGVYKS
jgi:hypothetical protein